jgi:hypothetical protein
MGGKYNVCAFEAIVIRQNMISQVYFFMISSDKRDLRLDKDTLV